MGSWTIAVTEKEKIVAEPEAVLSRVIDDIILGPAGILANHYAASGLKQRSSLLFDGITKRGWIGNVVRLNGHSATVGLDYSAISYSRPVIEGHGEIVPKNRKALRFFIDGRVVFAKRVKSTPGRRIYFLTSEELTRCASAAAREVARQWSLRA